MLSLFLETLEIALINCEIISILTWSENCVISSSTAANPAKSFAITDTKLFVPVVALSTDANTKLLQQLKSRFRRTINWNKYRLKAKLQTQN